MTSINFLEQLFEIIKDRKLKQPAGSYTTSLFQEGVEKILAKVEEESGEVLHATRNETAQRLVEESADLLFHLLVLLVNQQIELQEVIEELKKRSGASGANHS